jgi:hypothetical protein
MRIHRIFVVLWWLNFTKNLDFYLQIFQVVDTCLMIFLKSRNLIFWMENMANHNSADKKSLFLKISCFKKEYDNIRVTKYHSRKIQNQRIIRKKFIDLFIRFFFAFSIPKLRQKINLLKNLTDCFTFHRLNRLKSKNFKIC